MPRGQSPGRDRSRTSERPARPSVDRGAIGAKRLLALVAAVGVVALGATVVAPSLSGSPGPPVGDGATAAPTGTASAPSATSTDDAAPSTPTSADGSATDPRATVVAVSNATAVTVEYPNGSRVEVRLAGVAAPAAEGATTPAAYRGVPNDSTGRRWLRDWGETARAFAASELQGEAVVLTPFGNGDGSTGTPSVYLYHDGLELFNLQLVQLGYARAAGDAHPRPDAFAHTQAVARSRDVGLWGFEAANATASDE